MTEPSVYRAAAVVAVVCYRSKRKQSLTQLAQVQAPAVSAEPSANQVQAQLGDWQALLFLYIHHLMYKFISGTYDINCSVKFQLFAETRGNNMYKLVPDKCKYEFRINCIFHMELYLCTVVCLSLWVVSNQVWINFGLCMTLYRTIEPIHLLPAVKCNNYIIQ